MGMAASQLRLLSLTSRLHDVEFQAQTLEAQKLALATQEDEIYQTYCEALDATKVQTKYMGANGGGYYIDTTFNNFFGYDASRVETRGYLLSNAETGKIMVPANIQSVFERFGSDKYGFAMALCYPEFDYIDNKTNENILGSEIGTWGYNLSSAGPNFDDEPTLLTSIEYQAYEAWANGDTSNSNDIVKGNIAGWNIMSETELEVFLAQTNENTENSDNLRASLFALVKKQFNDNHGGNKVLITKKDVQEFRDYLYSVLGDTILETVNKKRTKVSYNNINKNIYNEAELSSKSPEFRYYLDLWEGINEAGGCETMNEKYMGGKEGAEWLKNMLDAGKVVIKTYNNNALKSMGVWEETSVATENTLLETQDEDGLAKAEADYQYQLKLINRKDKKYDLELSKLETERKAITTELDSIKTVKDENIDRTFKIFS